MFVKQFKNRNLLYRQVSAWRDATKPSETARFASSWKRSYIPQRSFFSTQSSKNKSYPTRKRVRYPAESKLNASIPERCPRAAAEGKDVGVFVGIREASLSGFKETVDDSHLLFSLFLLVRNRTAKCKCSESSKLTYFRHFCDCQRKWAGLLYYSDELIFSWHVICRVFVVCDVRLSAGEETRS